jgi:VanZ family protein
LANAITFLFASRWAAPFDLAVPGRTTFFKYWLPVVLWMALIFSASSDAMSAQRTSRIIGPLLRWLKPDISDQTVYRVQYAVRKTAHMVEYAILALLLWRARRKPIPHDTRPWRWREALIAFGFATLYSATDEFHQAWVPTRQARVGDVLLDAAGAALGLVLLWGVGRWRRRW